MSVAATPLPCSSTPGLTEREAQARRACGQGNDADVQSGRTYLQILRDNVFTFFNFIFFSLGLMMALLGSFNDAFFTVIVAFINVLVTTFQEARAKRRLDRIALLTRPRARVVRDGKEREIDPREAVLGDVLIAGAGDQIIVDGVVAGEAMAELDESLLTGEGNVVTKTPGDPVLSGSFVLSGTICYTATQVGTGSFANQLTITARAFRHQLTPFQVEINWLIRVLLLLVAMYELMVFLAVWVRGGMTLLQVTQEAAVIVGLSPVGLFMMLIAAYALGAVRITNKGAVVQRINAVESLSNVTVLCLDKTGTLTSG
jgi:cation-transporting ATPase E